MSEKIQQKYSLTCSNCNEETTYLRNGLCLECYFILNSPTKVSNISWIFLPAPRRFDTLKKSNKASTIKEDVAENIINKNYTIDKNNSIIKIGSQSFSFNVVGIDKLAYETGILIGKWLIYRDELEIDDLWAKIGKSLLKGKLGVSAKVSTAYSKSKRYVICVYTYNYLDIEDVEKVRKELLFLGVEETLCYKPDIYTYLNIYSGKSTISPCRHKK